VTVKTAQLAVILNGACGFVPLKLKMGIPPCCDWNEKREIGVADIKTAIRSIWMIF